MQRNMKYTLENTKKYEVYNGKYKETWSVHWEIQKNMKCTLGNTKNMKDTLGNTKKHEVYISKYKETWSIHWEKQN